MLKTLGIALVVAASSSQFSLANCGNDKDVGKGCAMAAPEIDPSSAVAGLTLLAGGLAVMLGRRSKRLQTQAE
jgi:hypothetical protein